MTKIARGALAALLLTTAGASAQDVTLRYAFQNPESHPLAQAAARFAESLSERTDGAVEVQLYPGGQLGKVKDVVQNLQLGAIDMTLAKPGHVADLGAEAFNVLSLPYMFTDQEHMRRVLHDEIGDEMLTSLGDIRLQGVGFYLDSPRHFFTVDTPVETVEDMAGLKIRTLTSEVAADTVEAFGASATPMAFSELYGALQSGVVDGADQPLTGFHAQQYQEVAGHIVLDGHDASPTIILMSQQAWDKLDEAQKEAVRAAHQDAADFFFEFDASENTRIRAELEEAGVSIVDVEDKGPWQAAVEPIVARYAEDHGDLIDRIRAAQ
jgi:tripartite ATP-independent transporter DctP family solute receptor